MTAFCTSSNEARPETNKSAPRSGSRPSRVDRVMPSHVFTKYQQFARRTVEERRRVKPAGLLENPLGGAQSLG